ncbi:alpha/beta fold hydrolase [Acinetobacter halotolerans]|uniref:Alpha/beta fold hydrolase n=1 Tax=Acinetobacter halotolerans TaxID=1752076 RepID=A0A4Q6XJD3_9GAMM|nr:alpha/beta fold hydrolase [Acinetobacter halotolerans]RZF55855.1 alpha/beta fold hydrolase [Acinetobacter halotolerans]
MSNRNYPNTSEVKTIAQKSTFLVDGTTCAATLHTPIKSVKNEYPAILMVGGWGSIQEGLTTPFVNQFVAEGYAVMEFDYPSWGLSGGWPRQDINPWTRVKTANAALAHLKSQTQVDAHSIYLWGTSFGGGHVVDLASQHPELQGAIIQVPMLDGLATVRAVPLKRLAKFISYGFLDLIKLGSPLHIPTLSKTGEFGSMDRDQAWEALQIVLKANNGKKYDNRVTARSLLKMGFYRPWTRLKDIQIPMLIIGATRDTVAPFVPEKIKSACNPLLQVVEMDANHFDPYFEPYFPETIQYQLNFLKKYSPLRHLKI